MKGQRHRPGDADRAVSSTGRCARRSRRASATRSTSSGTIFGADLVNPHDVLAINGASAALMLSGIPFDGPIGAVRVAWSTEGTWIPHATYQEGDESSFELVVAGRALSEHPTPRSPS